MERGNGPLERALGRSEPFDWSHCERRCGPLQRSHSWRRRQTEKPLVHRPLFQVRQTSGEAPIGAQDNVLVAHELCCAARVGADDDPGIGRPTINPGDDVPDLAPGCLPGNQEVLLLQHYLLRYFVIP